MTSKLRVALVALVAFAAGFGAMLAMPASATHREGTGEGNQVVRRAFGNDQHGYVLHYTDGTVERFSALRVALAQCDGVTSRVDRLTCAASVQSTYAWLPELKQSSRYWHNRVARVTNNHHHSSDCSGSGPCGHDCSGPGPCDDGGDDCSSSGPCPTTTEPTTPGSGDPEPTTPTTPGSGDPEPTTTEPTTPTTPGSGDPEPTTGSGPTEPESTTSTTGSGE